MTRKATPDRPLFKFLEITAHDAAAHPRTLEDIIAGRLDGAIVKGVLAPEVASAVAERLARGEHPFPKLEFPEHAELEDAPHLLGQPIVRGGDLGRYFAAAEVFRRQCRALFGGLADFEASVEGIFSALSGGCPASVPPGPLGETYSSATIRVLPEGHEIGLHVGNEFLRLPHAEPLLELLEPADQLSFFVTLSPSRSGGELVVYGFEWDDVSSLPFLPSYAGGPASIFPIGSPAFELVERHDKMLFKPDAGDLLVFNGGRFFHRVSPVVGPTVRRTIGGFLGFSKERDRVLYWS